MVIIHLKSVSDETLKRLQETSRAYSEALLKAAEECEASRSLVTPKYLRQHRSDVDTVGARADLEIGERS